MNAITVMNSNGITPGTAQGITANMFNDFVNWIDRGEATTKTYIINLRQFAAWLRYAEITQPTRADIIAFRNWLTQEHESITLTPNSANGYIIRTDKCGNPITLICKPNTVKAYLRSVCQFFKWTEANGLYPNIAQNIHAPKVDNSAHKKDHFTPEQVLTIEKHIAQRAEAASSDAAIAIKDRAGRMQRTTEQGARLNAMYQLAVNCGLRTIELSRANIKDLQTKDGKTTLLIWGKGRTEPDQRKPVAPEVMNAINEYLNLRTDNPTSNSPLFVSTGNRSKGQRIASTTISKMLKSAMIDAGFNSERLTAHSLRHSTGTAIQSITGDLLATQKYMRHADPKTTEIYIHESDAEDAKAADLAQELYNLYHGVKNADISAQYEQAIIKLTPQQLEYLTELAVAMAR